MWKATQQGKYTSEEEAVEDTVRHYVQGLEALSKRKNLEIGIHTIRPPPHPAHSNRPGVSPDALEGERYRVMAFNQALRNIFENEQFDKIFFLDVYEQLCDEEGWLQLEFQNDDIHLNHKYLPYLQQEVNKIQKKGLT